MHDVLLSTNRNGYTDSLYWGSIYLFKNNNCVYKKGDDINEIVFMRSLAKPLQTAIIADAKLIDDFKLTSKEIAIFCASHAGSPEHIEVLNNLRKKFKIKLSQFELIPQNPLDMRNFKGKKTKLHNNCSGKHLMMLIMCKYLNLDSKNYTCENHPIQKYIHKKQTELSGFESNILTHDGCSTPLWGLSYKNIANAYNNFFHDKKYQKIINSILNEPYIFGGYNRLDSEIIKIGRKNLFSKVGAGGFVLIYNFEQDSILLIKLAQNNNEIRRLVALKALNDLGWADVPVEYNIYNQKKQQVAKYCYKYKL